MTKFFLIFVAAFFLVAFLGVAFLAVVFLTAGFFVVAVTMRLANFLSDYSTYHNGFFSDCQGIYVFLIGETRFFDVKNKYERLNVNTYIL